MSYFIEEGQKRVKNISLQTVFVSMIHYFISYQKAYQHFVDFELSTSTNGVEKMYFQLAAWRPGRYELGNFAQNIQKWAAFDQENRPLPFHKITKDLWEVETLQAKQITIVYNYYANQLDAGACYLDEHQIYLNPVHCMFYILGRENEEYKLELDLPQHYQIATSLQKKDNLLEAKGYDQLAESPIICSDSLQYGSYSVDNVSFHVWFQGSCKPDWDKLLSDFKRFTQTQIKYFGSFPVNEYHFLFQITPYISYHGVEHTQNTVLLIGPGQDIMDLRYDDLLGICSHELYHTWNVKAIRPIELMPYDYTKENYFRTGFVAEGVTTYMGDLMLCIAGVFTLEQFVKTQNQNLERHLTNFGRHNLSVADSGFDTWLDGYKLGVPDRKTSIYPDAALCMLMIDLEIISNTEGKASLHTVMKELYEQFAQKGKGYTEDDFRTICVKFGGLRVEEIFEEHIYGTEDYIPSLKHALEVVGIELKERDNPNPLAQYFGMIAIIENGKNIIKKVEPNAIADQNCIAPEDEILKVNGKEIAGSLSNMLQQCNQEVVFTIKKKIAEKEITLKMGDYFKLLEFSFFKIATEKQIMLRKVWCNN